MSGGEERRRGNGIEGSVQNVEGLRRSGNMNNGNKCSKIIQKLLVPISTN